MMLRKKRLRRRAEIFAILAVALVAQATLWTHPLRADGLETRNWEQFFSGCVPALATLFDKPQGREIARICACQEEAAARYGHQEVYDLLAQGSYREVSNSARSAINGLYTEICTDAEGNRDTPTDPVLLERVETWLTD